MLMDYVTYKITQKVQEKISLDAAITPIICEQAVYRLSIINGPP